MPLVIFKVAGNSGYPQAQIFDSLPLDGTRFTVNLPREAYNKKWILRSVNALYTNGDADVSGRRLRWIEVSLPQLMEETSTFYHLEKHEDDADIPTPPKRLRFYPNRVSFDQVDYDPSHESVVVSPNLNMGTHRLDRLQIDLFVWASRVDEVATGLVSFEIILEYQ